MSIFLVLPGCSASASSGLVESDLSETARDVIRVPLTLYLVLEEDAADSAVSSRRSTHGLETIGDDIALIWAQADIIFEPFLIREIKMLTDVLKELILTEAEQLRARTTALEILDDAP